MAVKKATSGNSSKLDLIYSKESFVENFATILHASTELSDADFDVLLLYMSRDCGAIAYDGKVRGHYIHTSKLSLDADRTIRPSNSYPPVTPH